MKNLEQSFTWTLCQVNLHVTPMMMEPWQELPSIIHTQLNKFGTHLGSTKKKKGIPRFTYKFKHPVWGANEWIFGYIESDISSRSLWDFCDLTRALELRKLLVFMPWKLQFNHFQTGKFLQFQLMVLLVYTPWIAPILEACDGQSWWTKGSCHYDAKTLHLLVGRMFFKS